MNAAPFSLTKSWTSLLQGTKFRAAQARYLDYIVVTDTLQDKRPVLPANHSHMDCHSSWMEKRIPEGQSLAAFLFFSSGKEGDMLYDRYYGMPVYNADAYRETEQLVATVSVSVSKAEQQRRASGIAMGEVADMYTQDGTVDVKGNPAEKKSTGNWRACPYILANECCERLAYYGMSTNLVNYMKTRLGQESAIAANNVTNWSGTCYITPLIGAFLADAYMGRFWTIASFMIIYILGLALLTMASSVRGLVPACDGGTCHPTEAQTGVVFLALYLIALGTGGIKPCVSSFGADQFDENDEGEKRSKSSFFNWFYFSINIGALVASSVLVYVQTHVGWGWGFGIPAVVMAVAVVSFFVGTPLYRHQRPGGSPVTRIAQVLVASARKWGVAVPADKSRLHETVDKESGIEGSRKLEHTEQFACLDRAAVETPEDRAAGAGRSPWRLCTVTQVEELKSVLQRMGIGLVISIFSMLAAGVLDVIRLRAIARHGLYGDKDIVPISIFWQVPQYFIIGAAEGNTLDASMGPHFSIPAASLSIFDTLSVIAWVPVYDRLIVPAGRALPGRPRGFTQLQRMGIGLVISIFSMLAAGVLDVISLRAIARHGLYGDKDIVPISIFWQVPQYFIIGAAEVFTFVGQLEFFYDQAPDAMRSMCSALSLTTVALGNYLSTLLVTIVTHVTTKNGAVGWIPDNLNRGHLDYFFWLLAVLSLINFVVYLVIASWYTYKKTADSPDDDKADHHAAN
uniref:Uncharacterized protein n=1 Tax=Oryza brachyantha TaxID=4533 RepID=J3KWB9_ORYBR